MEDLSNIRRTYNKSHLEEENVNHNPFKQFELWMHDALSSNLLEPTAVAISTVSESGRPSSRIVLLKHFDERGFVFFTNYTSRKGTEISQNPYIAMLFFWDKLERQVRIEGKVEKVSREESKNYFESRPYGSRLGAWASHQSKEMKSRDELTNNIEHLKEKYPDDVPLPDFWGGFRLVPDAFEFWQGRESRLHDRIKFTLQDNNWRIARLMP